MRASYFVGTLSLYTVWQGMATARSNMHPMHAYAHVHPADPCMRTVWQDRWGVLRWLSRRTRLSLFLFYGRWGLPIPRRHPITAIGCFTPPPGGAPIVNPSAEQLDEHHERVYGGLAQAYDNARAALGLPEGARLLIK